MSKSSRRPRRIRVRGIRRQSADLQRLARAIIELAQAQVEADAKAEHDTRQSQGGDHPARPEEAA